ncbi:MAG: YdeI/OmpD-associated family protein, partial [Planctomycetota bacterium]
QLDFSSGKRLRVDGEIQGVPFQGALMPVRGRWYLMVSKRLQRECRVTLGDVVNVQFDVANQDALDVPRELLFALEADDAAMRIWDGWTIGKRRGWCHRVDVAKRVETRERRVDEVLAAIAKEIAER